MKGSRRVTASVTETPLMFSCSCRKYYYTVLRVFGCSQLNSIKENVVSKIIITQLIVFNNGEPIGSY